MHIVLENELPGRRDDDKRQDGLIHAERDMKIVGLNADDGMMDRAT